MLTLVRFAPVTRYVGRERVISRTRLVVARAVFVCATSVRHIEPLPLDWSAKLAIPAAMKPMPASPIRASNTCGIRGNDKARRRLEELTRPSAIPKTMNRIAKRATRPRD